MSYNKFYFINVVIIYIQISGTQGAKNIAIKLEEQLKANGEQLDFLLDEGMFVMQVDQYLNITTCTLSLKSLFRTLVMGWAKWPELLLN